MLGKSQGLGRSGALFGRGFLATDGGLVRPILREVILAEVFTQPLRKELSVGKRLLFADLVDTGDITQGAADTMIAVKLVFVGAIVRMQAPRVNDVMLGENRASVSEELTDLAAEALVQGIGNHSDDTGVEVTAD